MKKQLVCKILSVLVALWTTVALYLYLCSHDCTKVHMLMLSGISMVGYLTAYWLYIESKPLDRQDYTLLLVGLIIMVSMLCSCSSTKYGCGHGNPRMSWNKMVRSINRP